MKLVIAKVVVVCIAVFSLALLATACGSGSAIVSTLEPSPTPSPSPTALPTITASPTAEPTAEATPQPTTTPAPTVRPTPAPSLPAPTSPPAGGSARVIAKGDASRKIVTLTFDAGSDTGFTGQILDTLSSYGVVADFGLTGRWAEQNPALVRRIVNEGHGLINHSYDHSSFTGRSTNRGPLSQAQRWEQLDMTENIIASLTGDTTKPYFRPPYGDYDASVNQDVYARGYTYNVMWTVDSRGWQRILAQEIVQRCLSLAEPGAIYIFHVGSESQDAAALSAIIEGLRQAGYSIVPLSQLIGR